MCSEREKKENVRFYERNKYTKKESVKFYDVRFFTDLSIFLK